MEYTPDEPFKEDCFSSTLTIHTTIEFWTPRKEFFISVIPNSSRWMTGASEAVLVSFRSDPDQTPLVTQWMDKMEAIKTIRGLAGITLKEAKEAVDRLAL